MDSTLNSLVDRVRGLIGDPAGSKEHFDRDAVEDALRQHVMYVERRATDQVVATGGGAQIFYLPFGNFADDTLLLDAYGEEVAAGEIDYHNGRWTFYESRTYPLYVTGRSFDIHGAAADLLERWAADVKLEIDLSVGDIKLTRSQKAKTLMEMAKTQRGKMRLQTVKIVDESYTSNLRGADYRRATAPPPM